jgi:N-ethylmaleimide reductase
MTMTIDSTSPARTSGALLSPIRIGPLSLPNRVVMAPMTRSRADAVGNPTSIMTEYYEQRAGAGLIISEGVVISPQGKGYPNTPGIFTDRQTAEWARIVDALHDAGGRIFAQLWHVGRVSHPSLQPGGALPVAPSAIAATGQLYTPEGMKPFIAPRALETGEIAGIVEDFRQAAARAKRAGVDGVELHGANRDILDKFIREGAHQRTHPNRG